jgi:hypothetical protein
LAAWVLATSACSYTFTIGPHEHALGGTPATCTTSRVPPVADTVLALASATAAVAAVYACDHSSADEGDEACIRSMLLAPPAVVTALIYGLSARRGYLDTSACAREHDAELGQR